MSAGTIICIILFCSAAIGVGLGNIVSILMGEELDRGREDSTLDSCFSFTRRGLFRTFREYRSSCPNGRLYIYSLVGYALAIIGVIGFAVCFAVGVIRSHQSLNARITSPTDGAVFAAAANIVINADSIGGNYRVSRVDFYQGATLIGSSQLAPYRVTWSHVPAGNYSLTAKATDDRGTTTTSHAVSITVRGPGKESP